MAFDWNSRWLHWIAGAGILLAGFAGGLVLSGYARAGSDGSSAADWVSAGANLLMALAAIGGIIAAVLGFRSWKRELHGKGEYEFSYKLILAIQDARASFEGRGQLMFQNGNWGDVGSRVRLLSMTLVDSRIKELNHSLNTLSDAMKEAIVFLDNELVDKANRIHSDLLFAQRYTGMIKSILSGPGNFDDEETRRGLLNFTSSGSNPDQEWGRQACARCDEIINKLRGKLST